MDAECTTISSCFGPDSIALTSEDPPADVNGVGGNSSAEAGADTRMVDATTAEVNVAAKPAGNKRDDFPVGCRVTLRTLAANHCSKKVSGHFDGIQ
jgi:hypothetical protein